MTKSEKDLIKLLKDSASKLTQEEKEFINMAANSWAILARPSQRYPGHHGRAKRFLGTGAE